MPTDTPNLLTFTEIDPNNRMTVTASKVDCATLDRNEDGYVYDDYGTGQLDDFSLNFEIFISSGSQNNCIFGPGITSSIIDTLQGWAANDAACVAIRNPGPAYVIRLYEGDLSESGDVAISADTLYYGTLARLAGNTSVTMDIYSDSGRTIQVGAQQSITISGAAAFRYLYAGTNYNGGSSARAFTGYVQNISITSSGIVTFTPKEFTF